MAWHRKPPHLLPPERVARGREDHPERPPGQEIRLPSPGELHRRITRGLGNRKSKRSRPADVTDVHPNTDVREATDRACRADLKRSVISRQRSILKSLSATLP